ASRTEQFEERALPEEIEVGRVQMRVVAESLGRLSDPNPAILDSCQAVLIEADGLLRFPCFPDDTIVNDGHDDECGNWRGEPHRYRASPQADRYGEYEQEDQTQPNVSKAGVNGCAVVHRLPSRV